MIDEAFFMHLNSEDELGVVVRAHIHIEASLNAFVDARVPYPDRLPRLPYEGRLRLACALGLMHSHFDALKVLADIRNSFGHRVDAKLTDGKLKELYGKLPPETQELVVRAYEMTNRQRGFINPPEFPSLSPKDRFVLIAVMLKSFVVAAAYQAKSPSDNA